ncbi:DUF3841 domain-containing protein [Acidaminobacter sp. JC074]|uniref:DUF3841 domain-containing protein n=1 Tax=Acidaminobacter sp. JC074 TaxID=2530199 RepID=UPI001F103EBA|nr:DUF3841 domain-containing protein [Acidaminobacter sp. JC074]MCH4890859.1 DUF3841 domain-containing protein [Acidaminobacter sp. JC074]
MRVWTRQHKDVLKVIEEKGVYRVDPKHINMKMEEYADYYKSLYKWYSKRAEKLVTKPDDITYPVWVSIDEEMQLQIVDDTVIFEMEIDESEIVITDLEKWGYVVNYFYLPRDEKDLKKHYSELERYSIADESAIIMSGLGNHYPLLKRKIQSSWERLFEPYRLSTTRQGTIWEIKKEWITNIIRGSHEGL